MSLLQIAELPATINCEQAGAIACLSPNTVRNQCRRGAVDCFQMGPREGGWHIVTASWLRRCKLDGEVALVRSMLGATSVSGLSPDGLSPLGRRVAELGLSLSDLTRLTGIAPRQAWELVHDPFAVVDDALAVRLARALCMTPSELSDLMAEVALAGGEAS